MDVFGLNSDNNNLSRFEDRRKEVAKSSGEFQDKQERGFELFSVKSHSCFAWVAQGTINGNSNFMSAIPTDPVHLLSLQKAYFDTWS